MANELSAKIILDYSKNGVERSFDVRKQVTVSGNELADGTYSIGTSAEVVDLGTIATPGLTFFRNLDATNYIEIALEAAMTNKVCKLKAGEWALLRPSSVTLYAKATGGACIMEVFAVED